jgi:Calx-beta domain
MLATTRRLLSAVLVALAAIAVAMIGIQPANAAPVDCWYCTVTINDSHRSEYRSAVDLGWMAFTVRLGWVPTTDVTVGYNTLSGTAAEGVDFYSKDNSTVKIEAGETSATVFVTVKADTVPEPNHFFRVQLTSTSSGHLGNGDNHQDGVGVGWIVDDDPARLSVMDAQPVNEYNDLVFTVRLSAPLDDEVKVTVATQTPTGSGNATPNADYVVSGKALTFAPGETVKTFTVDVLHDQSIHEAIERMRVHLHHNSGATIADSEAWGTIYEVDFIS